jgi:hypothetical protein
MEPRFESRIKIANSIEKVDAVIATGSDNTARYFKSHFQKIPHLIRKNRTSVAILDGKEKKEDLVGLSDDIFLYFGLGCRNVSKIYLPENYDPAFLISTLTDKQWLGEHPKYNHNYIYQKSILTILDHKFLDLGFSLFLESDKLVSPISVVYYAYYKEFETLKYSLKNVDDKIQTLVTKSPEFENAVNFGCAQFPDLRDYADQVDTLKFLLQLR